MQRMRTSSAKCIGRFSTRAAKFRALEEPVPLLPLRQMLERQHRRQRVLLDGDAERGGEDAHFIADGIAGGVLVYWAVIDRTPSASIRGTAASLMPL